MIASGPNGNINPASHPVNPSLVPPKRSKVLRYVVTIAGLLAVVAALAGIKFSQISSLMAMGETMQKMGAPPESVSSSVSETQVWEARLHAVGNVASVKGVNISNDAPGVVSKLHFDSGAKVKQGQVLLELDASVERAQLASARVRRDFARTTSERTTALRESGVVSAAQFDVDESNLKSAGTEIQAIEAQIARKIVRAPFSGKLGIRNVNLGQYLNPGTPITVLEAEGSVYIDFTLPQQQVGAVQVGMPVQILVEGPPKIESMGAIAAVEPTVDNATRNLKFRATVADKDNQLRPGMFVKVDVLLPQRDKVVIVPSTAVIHAPYGDSVFVVEDKKAGTPGMDKTQDGKTVQIARQQFVQLGEERGDFVVIKDGVKVGEELVSAGGFKLRNNSPVVVDNSVKSKAALLPKLENR